MITNSHVKLSRPIWNVRDSVHLRYTNVNSSMPTLQRTLQTNYSIQKAQFHNHSPVPPTNQYLY